MGAHAKLSPSKRHRWAVCPGSIREEARYPESSSGPAAIDGTHTHTLLEYCLKTPAIAGPMHMVGHTMKDHEGEFTVDQDRANRVQTAIDYIRSRIKDAPTYELLSEERVDPLHLLGRDDLGGTVDCQLWVGDVYELIDYKDGMGLVQAKDNPQLELYAYGVLSRFKLTPFEPYPFSTVRMTIIQPKLALKGMPPVSSHEVSVADLLAKIPQVITEAKATDDPNAPLVPGDSQCKFCQHKGACAALAGNAMQEVGLMFQPIEPTQHSFKYGSPDTCSRCGEAENHPNHLAPLDMAQESAKKDPTQMTDDQLRQVLEAAPLVRQFLEGAEAEAVRRMESGHPVPGFKLVRGRGTRKWALPEDQMVETLKKMGLPKDALYKTELISPAQAEKVEWVKKVKGVETKTKLSPKQLERLDEYIAKSSGKLVIAPEADPREAVVTNAAPLFQAVEPVNPQPALPAWLM